MRRQLALAPWPLLLVVGLAQLGGCSRLRSASVAKARPNTPRAVPGKAKPAPAAASPAPLELPAGLAWLAIGGGANPASTEVSLEQDLALVSEILAGPRMLLFAGGSDSQSVRVLDDQLPADPLLVRLGELFQPHTEHRSRFRAPRFSAAPATRETVESELEAAFSQPGRPLVVYIAAHGQQGDKARDNSVVLWGGRGLSVARLAELHDAHPRPLRLISASCYSGGFGELAFTAADPKRGATRAPRCGLFAGTWDRETSGCDPDPDRRKQEGYSLHLLQALAGRDRDGVALPRAELDLDGDGAVSLREAHARASVAGRSIDVPTTTSERYLREVQKQAARPDFSLLPEEAAIVKALGARLDAPDQATAQRRWRADDRALRELDAKIDQADAEAQARFGELSARLLGRFPLLDDPYHAGFAELLARERRAIEAALEDWPEVERYEDAQDELDALDQESQRLELEEAQLVRLTRAYETLGLAAALKARGGPAYANYQALLACERFVPALQTTSAQGRDATAAPR